MKLLEFPPLYSNKSLSPATILYVFEVFVNVCMLSVVGIVATSIVPIVATRNQRYD
jgi:hypothetical protein